MAATEEPKVRAPQGTRCSALVTRLSGPQMTKCKSAAKWMIDGRPLCTRHVRIVKDKAQAAAEKAARESERC